jgi:hypothetical protein
MLPMRPETTPPLSQKSARKRGVVVGRDRLTWHRHADRLALCLGKSRSALAGVEPDGRWPGMFRVRFPDGTLSDMVNLTRAKDAALVIVLCALNSDPQEQRPGGSHVCERRAEAERVRNQSHPWGSWRRSCGRPLMSRIRRPNRISGQWSARLFEMLDSPERALWRSAHLLISRIEVERARRLSTAGRLPRHQRRHPPSGQVGCGRSCHL